MKKVLGILMMSVSLVFGATKQSFAKPSSELSNWHFEGNANWSEDSLSGEVQANLGKGFLVSKSIFRNFEIRLEFWADEKSNSGVFFRCSMSKEINDKNCYEANIFDSRPDQSGRTGAIVHVAAPAKIIMTEGRWNTYIIRAVDDHLTMNLNGIETVNVRNSEHKQGVVALQFAQGEIKFRNINLKSL